MNNILKYTLLILICLSALFVGSGIFAAQNPIVNAGPDLYVSQNQTIVLQGSAYDPQSASFNYYWNCSGGTLSSYNTAQPSFTPPTTSQYGTQNSYTCSLTATNTYGLSATDSMVVFVNYNNYNSYNSSTLAVSNSVINLTSGNLGWASSVNAKPGDILSFAVTMQAGNQTITNVNVRDLLPAGLVYKGNLTVNASLNNSDPTTGIYVGTIPANGISIIAFQAQVVSYGNYGANTLTNTATITSNEAGTQTATATIMVNNIGTLGVTDLSTGSTNYFLVDSFLLPMLLIVFMSWLYFTGRIYMFADYLGQKIK